MEIGFPECKIPKHSIKLRILKSTLKIHSCFKTSFGEVGKIKSEGIRGKKPKDAVIGRGLCCFV